MRSVDCVMGLDLYPSLFEIGLCFAKEGGTAVPAVWRLVSLLALIGTKENAATHRRDACAPLQKPKSKLLLLLSTLSEFPLVGRVSFC